MPTSQVLFLKREVVKLAKHQCMLVAACRAAIRSIGTNIMGESCNPKLRAKLQAAIDATTKEARRANAD